MTSVVHSIVKGDECIFGDDNVSNAMLETFGENYNALPSVICLRPVVPVPSNDPVFSRLHEAFSPNALVKIVPSSSCVCAQYFINGKMLKEIIVFIADELSFLFRLILSDQAFPDAGKHAYIEPINKSATEKRPVTINSPLFSAVFKTPFYDFLYELAMQNNIFPSFQFGFQKKMGCGNAIFHALSKISAAQSKNNTFFCAIFLDLAKAFDRLPHSAIIEALYHYDVPDFVVRIIASWLTGRTAVVSNGGVFSKEMDVVSGVPQGSKLGPLLFLYSLSFCVSSYGFTSENCCTFADDSTVMGPVSVPADVCHLQSLLDRYIVALDKVGLKVNPAKCAFVVFPTGRGADIDIAFSIDGVPIPALQHVKFLGVHLDSELEFSHHCEEMVKGCGKSIYNIKRLIKDRTIDLPTAEVLFKAKVLGKIQYGLAFTRPFFERDVNLLENVQRRFTKFFCPVKDFSYEQRLDKLSWPSIAALSDVQLLMYLYRCYVNHDDRNVSYAAGNVYNTRARKLFEPARLGLARKEHFACLAPYYGFDLFYELINSSYVNDADFGLILERKLPIVTFQKICHEFAIKK